MDKTKQFHTRSRQNNLHSVHSRSCGIYEQSGPQNKQHCTTHGNAPKVLSLTLDPKLTYSTHIHISVHAHNPLQIIKALTRTGWGKQKETRMANYKAVLRPALEYACSIWSPLASSPSINPFDMRSRSQWHGCSRHGTRSRCEPLANLSRTILIIFQIKTKLHKIMITYRV